VFSTLSDFGPQTAQYGQQNELNGRNTASSSVATGQLPLALVLDQNCGEDLLNNLTTDQKKTKNSNQKPTVRRSTSTDSELNELKRQRLIKNRQSASFSRQRMTDKVQQLQTNVVNYENELLRLQRVHHQLREYTAQACADGSLSSLPPTLQSLLMTLLDY